MRASDIVPLLSIYDDFARRYRRFFAEVAKQMMKDAGIPETDARYAAMTLARKATRKLSSYRLSPEERRGRKLLDPPSNILNIAFWKSDRHTNGKLGSIRYLYEELNPPVFVASNRDWLPNCCGPIAKCCLVPAPKIEVPAKVKAPMRVLARDFEREADSNLHLILADMLEDANVNDELLLSHARSNTKHVRGCFVMEGLL